MLVFSYIVQPGPRDSPLQCLIKRDKKNATFYLYLSLAPCKYLIQTRLLYKTRVNPKIIRVGEVTVSQTHGHLPKLLEPFL